MDEWNGSFQRLDSQQGKTVIVVSSAVVEKVEVIGDKRIQSPSQCKQCLQFGCTGETCCETHAEQGDELPPSDLTENRYFETYFSLEFENYDDNWSYCPYFSLLLHLFLDAGGGKGQLVLQAPKPLTKERGLATNHLQVLFTFPCTIHTAECLQQELIPDSQKASGNAKPSGTPGPTTTRKVLSTPRAPDTSRSLGPTTRRRAAAQLLSPRSQ